ncbi:ATP-binding cassette domain-containing protein [Leucobacter chromiireducens]|uniref:ATP-binding cassette domain-containing protein n=1 Tax=Leucobacter chromiireducens TaxID=283877 RepID=UPI000F63D2E7|nr:ATP-binding cassette domain-containing protein [Leucobacter chromiireducens]
MTAVTVRAERVAVTLAGRPALSGFSGTFSPGTVSALIGGDGAGKSTLLRALAGRLPVSAGRITGVPAERRRLGFQPTEAGVWRSLSVAENLAFVASVFRLPAATARDRGELLLERAGLQDARGRLAGALSGGMRQKLGVVLATLHEPELVLLDEPSTGVDPISRAELWALIAGAAADGATVVFATSYLDEAERASQLHLLGGGIVLAEGTAADVIARAPGALWAAPADSSQARAADAGTPADAGSPAGAGWRRGNTVFRWHRDPAAPAPAGFRAATPDLENASIALLLRAEEHTSAAGQPPLTPRPAPADTAARPLVDVAGAVQRFGSVTALDGVSLTVGPGEIVGLLGGNGAGKTTLMRVLLGLETPSAGSVEVFGAAPSRAGRRSVGYVAQGMGLYPSLSAAANLSFVAAVQGVPVPGELAAWAQQWGHAPAAELPLGARRQLACAAAALHAPALLVLDEPTSGMDALSRTRLWNDLHQQADAGAGILVSTHYMQEAAQCDRLVVLTGGRVSGAGTLAEVIAGHRSVSVTTPEWAAAFTLLRAAGLPALLDGRTLRVPGVPRARIAAALAPIQASGAAVELAELPATLEETMLLAARPFPSPAAAGTMLP